MYPVSITSQGQISIPMPIRKTFGLFKGSQAIVSVDNGTIVIEPVLDILDLAGTFKTNKKPLTNDQIHDVFASAMASRKIRPKLSK